MSEDLREIAERTGAEAYMSECIVEEETASSCFVDNVGLCVILNAVCSGDCRYCFVPLRRSIDLLTQKMSDVIITIKR